MKIRNTKLKIFDQPDIQTTPNGKIIVKATCQEFHFRKNKETNDWDVDSSSFYNNVVFVGDAVDLATTLTEGSKITVIEGEYRKPSYKDSTGRYRTTEKLLVYEFEIRDDDTN